MPRPHWHASVTIVKTLPTMVEGFDTSRFVVGQTYDVNLPLCDLLIASGYAEPATDAKVAITESARAAADDGSDGRRRAGGSS
jgi:hypothetical protein